MTTRPPLSNRYIAAIWLCASGIWVGRAATPEDALPWPGLWSGGYRATCGRWGCGFRLYG